MTFIFIIIDKYLFHRAVRDNSVRFGTVSSDPPPTGPLLDRRGVGQEVSFSFEEESDKVNNNVCHKKKEYCKELSFFL